MKDYFLHQPFFRLLSPLLVGNMAYFLILLLNNNVEQLQDQFLGAELYFSCGVALLIQEASRLVVLWWPDEKVIAHPFWRLGSMAFTALLISIIVTIIAVAGYYHYMLGYLPEYPEWLMFIGVFSFFSIIQLSLLISYHFLAASNLRRLTEEQQRKENLEADFNHFKHGINPDLLFESLEALIVCIHQDQDIADELLGQLSTVYRYILGKRSKELVPISEELEVLKEQIGLFNYLPYCNVELEQNGYLKGGVVPGVLLTVVERILRNSIVFPKRIIKLNLGASASHFILGYQAVKKIVPPINDDQMESLQRRYQIYSELGFIFDREQETEIIGIPIVHFDSY